MLFPPQVFVVLSLKKNMQEAGCVCVCVFYKGEVTHGGHSSGQHQLSECEVQPQAKASLPVGVNLTPLIYPHTHTATEPGATLAHTRLPPSKRCALHSAGTSPSL